MLKSKTMWFAYLLTVFGVLETNLPVLRNNIDPDLYGYLVVAIAIVVALLRAATSKPLKEK